jgi:TusA-related sulfurtransferase
MTEVQAEAARAPGSPLKDATAIEIGHTFVDAVVRRDFEAIEACLAPDVRFRALVPRAVREEATASGARSWFETWFGDTDRNELLDSRVELVADRLHVAYRIRFREDGAWKVVEQQVFATIDDTRLSDVALACSGFRAIDPPDDAPPGATIHGDRIDRRQVDARFDAVGRSCATLTPEIRTAVRGLEPGQVLEILSDDPTAEDGLRAWSRLTGNDLVGVAKRSDSTGLFYVRRGGAPAATVTTSEPGGQS